MKERLTPAEEEAFQQIMNFIDDYDACDMETYDSVIAHSIAVNNEQYYNSDQMGMYCVKLALGGTPLNITLRSVGHENMEINIYSKNDNGSRSINFIYDYDESNGDEEWYEVKPHWYADFTLQLYDTEEEYFQASTLDDLVLTYEENKMFIDFYNQFTEHLINRRGTQHGQSTP